MYSNQLINEAEVRKTWSPIIEESTGIKDKEKLGWMSKLCHYHNLNENVHNTVHLNPNMNTPGMGAATLPGSPGSMNNFGTQQKGSGDKAQSLLPIAMQVAGQTIGLDLVPVVPMSGPMGILTYLDYVYAGGKNSNAGGKVTKSAPLVIKANVELNATGAEFNKDGVYFVGTGDFGSYELTYVGKSRIDGYPIFRVRGKMTDEAQGANAYTQGEEGYEAIYQAIVAGSSDLYSDDSLATAVGSFVSSAEYVKALEDHIPGFSGQAFESNNPVSGALTSEGIDSANPYEREEGESTPDNLMGMTLFNKSVSAKTYQVAAAVTREQVQDLKQFGIDAVAQIESVLVNELTQTMNKLILDRIFRNGAENAKNINEVEGLNFSSYFVTTASNTTVNLGPGNNDNTDVQLPVTGTVVGTGGETQGSLQRRILSKVLAATNMISTRGRRGPATFAVCSGHIGTALQDIAGFVPYPMANTVNQNGGSLYPVGTIAGVTIYVNPEMKWNDLRVVVGRKGDGNSPGLVFMPYLMAESVETIAEGTMAPKLAVKSRFALVNAGFHPEMMYYTMEFKLGAGVSLI